MYYLPISGSFLGAGKFQVGTLFCFIHITIDLRVVRMSGYLNIKLIKIIGKSLIRKNKNFKMYSEKPHS